jgi:hypothetical protein
MSDVALFIFGSVVTITAFTGFWLFVYANYFRRSWMEQNAPYAEPRAVEPQPRGRSS